MHRKVKIPVKYSLKHIYKNFVRKFLASRAVAALAWAYIWFVFLTSSKVFVGPKTADLDKLKKKSLIYAFWHSRLMLMYLMPKVAGKVNVLISEHADGRIIGTVSKMFGRKVIWGSSKRGWLGAIKEIFAAFAAGESLAITPDGPKGPACEVNGNVIKIAAKSGLYIVPGAYGVRHKKILRSWDKFIVPLPFGKISFVYGEPMKVETGEGRGRGDAHVRDDEESRLNAGAAKLKAELDRVSRLADELVL